MQTKKATTELECRQRYSRLFFFFLFVCFKVATWENMHLNFKQFGSVNKSNGKTGGDEKNLTKTHTHIPHLNTHIFEHIPLLENKRKKLEKIFGLHPSLWICFWNLEKNRKESEKTPHFGPLPLSLFLVLEKKNRTGF